MKNRKLLYRSISIAIFAIIFSSLMPTVIAAGVAYTSTNPVTNIFTDSATLNGSVTPNNSSTVAWFEYGTAQSSLGNTTSTFQVGNGNSQINYSTTAFNLSPNTTYYYRTVAENSYGISKGSIFSFSTNQHEPGTSPSTISSSTSVQSQSFGKVASVNTDSVSYNLSQNSAIFHGSVNPNNSYTTSWFEYGRDQSLGYKTNTSIVGSGDCYTNFSLNASNLVQNSTYYYRAVASNGYGTSYGITRIFVTQESKTNGTANNLSGISNSLSNLSSSLSSFASVIANWKGDQEGTTEKGTEITSVADNVAESEAGTQGFLTEIFNLFPFSKSLGVILFIAVIVLLVAIVIRKILS